MEGQGRGIIMGVTRPLLLGPFYYIQTKFLFFFAHDCKLGLFTQMISRLDTYCDLAKFNKRRAFNKAVGPGKKSKINNRRAYVYSGL